MMVLQDLSFTSTRWCLNRSSVGRLRHQRFDITRRVARMIDEIG